MGVTSGIVYTNTEFDSYFCLQWVQVGQDTTNNKTTIAWEMDVHCGHNFYLNAISVSAFSINGTQLYGGGTFSNLYVGDHCLVSGTLTIPHNSDGSKTFYVSGFAGWLYADHNYQCNGGNFTLNQIPRQAVLTEAPNFNDEENPTIKYSNHAGSAVTTLQACISFNGSNDDIAYRNISKSGTSYTFNLTASERNVLKNATTGSNSRTVSFYIKTVIGGNTLYSHIDKTFTIVSGKPTWTASNITYQDIDSSVVAITQNNQKIVQNKSSLRVSFTAATAQKGASITGYSFTLNGNTQTKSSAGNIDFGTIDSANNLKLTAVVTDSRGNTTKVNKTITMLAYSTPTAIVSLSRLNNYEDTTYFKVDGSVSSVDNKNVMTIQYRYKQSGGSYNSWETIQDNVQQTLTCNKDYEFVFNAKVTDSFGGTFNKTYTLSKGHFPMFIDTVMNAVGINDFPQSGEALRVSGGIANFVDGFTGKGTIFNTEVTSDILAFAVGCGEGFFPINTNGNASTINVPSTSYSYSYGFIHRRPYGSNRIKVVLYAYDSNKIAINTYSGNSWSGWSTINDVVVEQGTSGIWKYRKWDNGISECFGTKTETISHYSAWGNMYAYRSSGDISFPSGLFLPGSRPTASICGAVSDALTMPASNYEVSDTRIRPYLLSSYSGSRQCVFDMIVKGVWK